MADQPRPLVLGQQVQICLLYTSGSNFEIVRSYMAHHLGMSLVAIDNALTEDVMQRRFLSDRTMAAYRELLQERVPVGAPVMRRRDGAAPERPRRRQGPDLLRTRCV